MVQVRRLPQGPHGDLGRPLRRRLASALVLGLALSLPGCGSAPAVQPDRFYSLTPSFPAGPGGPTAPLVVQVDNLGSRGFLGGRQIVYRTREEPLVVQRYDDLLWADPPPRALAQALVAGLRATQSFRGVVVPADRVRADYLLTGVVERFEHLPTEQPPRVAASLALTLVRADTRERVAGRQYSAEEPVDGDTPDAMAEAFNRLAARLVTETVRDLQTLVPQLGPAPGI